MAANRFKKSIENIVSNNVDDALNSTTEIASATTTDNTIYNTPDNALNNTMINNEINTSNNITRNTALDTLNNILNIIPKDEQRGKNITFYLSSEVEEAVTAIAKQNNISKSKLVDSILKSVLLTEK